MQAVTHILVPTGQLLLASVVTFTASTATFGAVAAESSRLYPIEVNGKLGLIDENGTAVVEPQFTYHETNVVGFCPPAGPRHFWWNDGMAIVWKDGKAGYVNSNGELVVEPQFEKAGMFYLLVMSLSPVAAATSANSSAALLSDAVTRPSLSPVMWQRVLGRM